MLRGPSENLGSLTEARSPPNIRTSADAPAEVPLKGTPRGLCVQAGAFFMPPHRAGNTPRVTEGTYGPHSPGIRQDHGSSVGSEDSLSKVKAGRENSGSDPYLNIEKNGSSTWQKAKQLEKLGWLWRKTKDSSRPAAEGLPARKQVITSLRAHQRAPSE